MIDFLSKWTLSLYKTLGQRNSILAILALVTAGYFAYDMLFKEDPPLPFSEFLTLVHTGKVADVTIDDQNVTGHFKQDDQEFSTRVPKDDKTVVETLLKNNVKIEVAEDRSILYGLMKMLPLLVFFYLLYRQTEKMTSRVLGRLDGDRKMLLESEKPEVTFDDVAGIDEAKQELQEIVGFLKAPEKFLKLGAKIPKGALLTGEPGVGKTLLARAVAGEAHVPFFSISGSDFVEKFVGVGASRVRELFANAKKETPCIIFIDEIDAMGRARSDTGSGAQEEWDQTMNQLLVEMDGFTPSVGIILIAATNRPDVLDPALLRPGRFDRQIMVPNPDSLGREKILRVHTAKIPLAEDVNLAIIARGTPGFSGADLANLANEAALRAARLDKARVGMAEFEWAKDKVIMGGERHSLLMTEEDRKRSAYHEAGHALAMLKTPGNDPVHKATIMPRGRSLGATVNLPENDTYNHTIGKLEARLTGLFGGREAERLLFGEKGISTGAVGDIADATKIARSMVTQFGVSDKVGSVNHHPDASSLDSPVSEATAAVIDQEILRLIRQAESAARQILIENRNALDRIAQALLERETLSGEEIEALLLLPENAVL